MPTCSFSLPWRRMRPSRCSTSAGFHGASRWCSATSRLCTLVPVPIFCVLPSSTRTWPARTRSNSARFLASESVSPTAAISARDALGRQPVGHLVVGGIAPGGGVDAQVAEDQLGAAPDFRLAPDAGDVLRQGG